MKIVILNKSDRRGGAAVVSLRLMEALRARGADARMVVAEKLSDSPYVSVAASPIALKAPFLAERLQIFLANGMDRSTLFKVDTGAFGINILGHPWVKEADVVMLNWVNQGFVSLDGVHRLARAGKRLIWTMHDLWCMTGICHHTGGCGRFRNECGGCRFLNHNEERPFRRDLATSVQTKKEALYSDADIHFVAVSSWLRDLARESRLLGDKRVSVIPNAFEIGERARRISALERPGERGEGLLRIVMGAARLDDTVKGLPVLVEATRVFARKYPEMAARSELVTFGGIRDPRNLEGMGIAHRHIGTVKGEDALAELYGTASVVVSTSEYETLPGTLIEGQAYGAIPVSFDRGGQRDIITPPECPPHEIAASDKQPGELAASETCTGFLVPYTSDLGAGAEGIADAIAAALRIAGPDIRRRMLSSVESRFSAQAVADAYLRLCNP